MKNHFSNSNIAAALLILSLVIPQAASAAGLTQPQINAVLGLLRAFDADPMVVEDAGRAMGIRNISAEPIDTPEPKKAKVKAKIVPAEVTKKVSEQIRRPDCLKLVPTSFPLTEKRLDSITAQRRQEACPSVPAWDGPFVPEQYRNPDCLKLVPKSLPMTRKGEEERLSLARENAGCPYVPYWESLTVPEQYRNPDCSKFAIPRTEKDVHRIAYERRQAACPSK